MLRAGGAGGVGDMRNGETMTAQYDPWTPETVASFRTFVAACKNDELDRLGPPWDLPEMVLDRATSDDEVCLIASAWLHAVRWESIPVDPLRFETFPRMTDLRTRAREWREAHSV
jgi:hypothetical protein